MTFTFVLVLCALAAYSHAIPSYGSGNLGSGFGGGLGAGIGLGGHGYGHNGRFLGGQQLGGFGGGFGNGYNGGFGNGYNGGFGNGYNGGFNRQGGIISGAGGGIIAPIVPVVPATVIGGQPAVPDAHDHIAHSHVCKCEIGEVCTETPHGKSVCVPTPGSGAHLAHTGLGGLQAGLGGVGVHLPGAIGGVGIGGVGIGGVGIGIRGGSSCLYMKFPDSCSRTPGRNTIPRFTFSNGVCRQFTSSRISSFCQPRNQQNNVFRSMRECQLTCLGGGHLGGGHLGGGHLGGGHLGGGHLGGGYLGGGHLGGGHLGGGHLGGGHLGGHGHRH